MDSQLHEDDLTEDVFASHQSAHSSKFSPRKWASSVGMSPVKKKMGRGSTHQNVEESSIDIYGDLSMDTIIHVEADETDSSQVVGLASNTTANMDLFTDVLITDRSEKDELENRIKELQEVNKKLVSDNVILQKSKDQVTKNISALFLTARFEISEKEKEIEELKQEIEDLKTAHAQHICHGNPPSSGQETPGASDGHYFGAGPEGFGHSGQEPTSSLQSAETYSPFELFKKGLGKRGGRERDGSPKRYSDQPSGKARDKPPAERRERSGNKGERPMAGFERDSRNEPFRQRELSTIDSRREPKTKPERDREREKYPTEANSNRDTRRSPVRSRRESWGRNAERERSRSPTVSNRDSERKLGNGKGQGKSRVKSRRNHESQSDRGRSPGRERIDSAVIEEISCSATASLKFPSGSARQASNRRSSYQDNCKDQNQSSHYKNIHDEANGDGMMETPKAQANVYDDRERRVNEKLQTREKVSERVGEIDLRAKLSRKRRAEGLKGKGMSPFEKASMGGVEEGQVRKDQLGNSKMNIKSLQNTSFQNNNNNNNNNNDINVRLINDGNIDEERDIDRGSEKGEKDMKRMSQNDRGLAVDLCGSENPHNDTCHRERGEEGSSQFFFLPDGEKVKVRKKKSMETDETQSQPDPVRSSGTSLAEEIETGPSGNPLNVNKEEVRSRIKKTCEAGTDSLSNSYPVEEVGNVEVRPSSSSTQETSTAAVSQKSPFSCDSQPQKMTTTNFSSGTGQHRDVKQPGSNDAPGTSSEDAQAVAISEDASFQADKSKTISTLSCTSLSPHSHIQAEDCFSSYKNDESHNIARDNVGRVNSDCPNVRGIDSCIIPRCPSSHPVSSASFSSQDFSSLPSNASLPFSHLMENTNNTSSQKGKEEGLSQIPPSSPISLSNHTWPFKPANSYESMVPTKTKLPHSFTSSSSTSSSSSSSSSIMRDTSGLCKSKAKPDETSVPSKASPHSEDARAFPITELQSASDQPSSLSSPVMITLTTPSPTTSHDTTKPEVLKTSSVVCVENVIEKTNNSQGTVNSSRTSFEANSRLGNDTDTNISMDVNSCQGSDSYQSLVPGRDLADEANLTPPKIRKKKLGTGTSTLNPSPFSPVSRKSAIVMCTPNLIVLGDEEASSGTLISPCKPHHVPSDLYPPGVRMNLQQVNTHRHIRGEPELLHLASDGAVVPGQRSGSCVIRGKAGNFDFLPKARNALFSGKRASSDDVNGLDELSESTSNETVESSSGEKKSGPERDDRREVLREETSCQPCPSEGRSNETEASMIDIRMESEESMLSVVREAFVKVFRKNFSTFKLDMAEKAAADHRLLKTTLQKSVGNILTRGRSRKARIRTSNGSNDHKTAKSQMFQDAKAVLPARRELSSSRTAKPQKKSHKMSSKILVEKGEHFAQISTVINVSTEEHGHLSDTVAMDQVPPCSKCHASLSCTCSNARFDSHTSHPKTTAKTPFTSPQKSLSGDSQGPTKSEGVFRFYLFPGVGSKSGQRPSLERKSDFDDNNSSSSAAVPAEMLQNKKRRNSEDKLIDDIISSLDTDWLEAIENDFAGKMEVNPKLCQTDPLQEDPGPQGKTSNGEISFAGRIPSSLNGESAIISEGNVAVQDRNLGVVESRVHPPATNGGTENDEGRQRESSFPRLHEKRLLFRGSSIKATCCASPDMCLVTSSDVHRESALETRLGSTRFSPFGVCAEEPDSTSEPFPQSTEVVRPSPRRSDIGKEAEIIRNSERQVSLPPDELARTSEFEEEGNRRDLPDSPQREPRLRHDMEITNTPKSSGRKIFRRKRSVGPLRGSRTSLKYRLFPRNERDDETLETFDKSSKSDDKSAHDFENTTHSTLINSTQNSNSDRNFSQLLRDNEDESPYPLPKAGTSHGTKDCMNTTFTVNTGSSSDDEDEDNTLLASPAKIVQEINSRRSSSFTSPHSREDFSPSPAAMKRRMPPSPMIMDELSLDARSLSEFDQDLSRIRQTTSLRTSSRTASYSSLISVGHDSPMSVSSHRFSTPASHRSPRDALLSPPDFKALDSCDEGHGEAFEGVTEHSKGCQSCRRDPEHCSTDPTVSWSPVESKKLSRHLSFHELRLLMLVKSKTSVIREEEEEEDTDSSSENDELSTPTPSSQSAHSLSYNQAKHFPPRERNEEGEESGSDEESGQPCDYQSCKMKSQRSTKDSRALGRSRSNVNGDHSESPHQGSENPQRRPDICVQSRDDLNRLHPEASNSNLRDQPAHSLLSQKETGENSQDAAPFEPRQASRKSVRIAELLPFENITTGSPPLTSTTEENNFILKRLNPSPLNSCQKTSSRNSPSMSSDRQNWKNAKEAKTKPQESCVLTDGRIDQKNYAASGGQRKAAKGNMDVDQEVLSWAIAHRKSVDKVRVKLDARLDESKPQSKVPANKTVCSTNIGRTESDTQVGAEKPQSSKNNKGFQWGNSTKVDKCSDKVVESVIIDENENDDFEDGEILDDTDGEDGCSLESSGDLSSGVGLENVKPETENESRRPPQPQNNRKPSSNADKLKVKGRPNSESSHQNVRDKASTSKSEKGMPSRRSKNFSTKSNPYSGHSASVVDQAHRLHHHHPSSSQRSGYRPEFGDDYDGRDRDRKRQRSPSPSGRSRSRPRPGRSKVRRGLAGERDFRRSFSKEREDDVDRRGGGGIDRNRGGEVKNYSGRDSYPVADGRRRDRYDGGGRNSEDRKSDARHRPDHSKASENRRRCVQSGSRGDGGDCHRLSPLRNGSRRSRSGSNTSREEGCQSRRDWQ